MTKDLNPLQDDKEALTRAVDAAIRAISDTPQLHGQYTGQQTPDLNPARYQIRQNQNNDTDEIIARIAGESEKPSLRGAGDSVALYLKHHDEAAHMRHMPSTSQARLAYDILEQVRCEALGTRHFKGIENNILQATEDFCQSRGYGDAERSVPVAREDALFIALRQQLFERPASLDYPASKSCSGAWAQWIAEKLGVDNITALKNTLDDAEKFAKLASALSTHIMSDGSSPDDNDDDDANQSSAENMSDTAEHDEEGENITEQDAAASAAESQDSDTAEEEQLGGEDMDQLAENQDSEGSAHESNQEHSIGNGDSNAAPRYKIFTEKYDHIATADDLASNEELHHLREKLDKQLEPLKAVVSKLANRLQRKLMAQQQRSWHFDVEEGILDSARLARIVTTPGSPLSYKQEKDTDFKDTIVTLLIDNSGSMRGRPITIAALSTDILARTLERCGIKVEILGFTTSAWKGGFSREDWGKAGRPRAPGRLNDILHIVYKPADSPWIRTRKNLGLMLKEGLLKENIDGEALRWSHNRLRRRPEHRKILMVISDGAPVDDSTLSANYAQYLEQDLKQTITDIEKQRLVELLAIGIGHDVTPYYSRAVTIKTAEELGSTMVDQLVQLFAH